MMNYRCASDLTPEEVKEFLARLPQREIDASVKRRKRRSVYEHHSAVVKSSYPCYTTFSFGKAELLGK